MLALVTCLLIERKAILQKGEAWIFYRRNWDGILTSSDGRRRLDKSIPNPLPAPASHKQPCSYRQTIGAPLFSRSCHLSSARPNAARTSSNPSPTNKNSLELEATKPTTRPATRRTPKLPQPPRKSQPPRLPQPPRPGWLSRLALAAFSGNEERGEEPTSQ